MISSVINEPTNMQAQILVQKRPLTAHSFVACVMTVATNTNILNNVFSWRFSKALGFALASRASLLKREQAIKRAAARGDFMDNVR